MCVHPYFIENKNRATALVSKSGSISVLSDLSKKNPLSKYKDITSHYTPVACGKCYECKTLRQSYKTQRFAMESLQCDFYFCTLTYDNDHLPVLSLRDDDTGEVIFEHSVPCVHHIQNFIKRIRKRNIFGRPFKYFVASEYGGKKHRAHYHILFCVPKDNSKTPNEKKLEAVQYGKLIQKEWSINVGTRKQPVYESLFTYHKKWQGGKLYRNYDFHYIEPRQNNADDDVFYYVTKYVLKSDSHVAKIISLVRHLTSDPDKHFTFDISTPRESYSILLDSYECDPIPNSLKSYFQPYSNESDTFNSILERFLKPFSLCSKHFGLPFSPSESVPENNIIIDYIKRSIQQSVRDSNLSLRSCFSIVLPHNGLTVPMSPYYYKRFADFSDVATINENLKAASKLLLDFGEDAPVFFSETDMSRSYVEPTPEDIQNDVHRLARLNQRITELNSFDSYADD